MATTSYLDITYWTALQSQPDVTINEAIDILEAAQRTATHDMASDADYTLDTSTGSPPFEWQYGTVRITDTGVVLTGGVNIICPDNAKNYVFINDTAQTLTLKTSGGSGIGVATSKTALLECDGTDVIRRSADF